MPSMTMGLDEKVDMAACARAVSRAVRAMTRVRIARAPEFGGETRGRDEQEVGNFRSGPPAKVPRSDQTNESFILFLHPLDFS